MAAGSNHDAMTAEKVRAVAAAPWAYASAEITAALLWSLQKLEWAMQELRETSEALDRVCAELVDADAARIAGEGGEHHVIEMLFSLQDALGGDGIIEKEGGNHGDA